jgi:hypothetical protein
MSASEPLFLKPSPQARLFPVETAPPPERTYWGLRSPHLAREMRARYPISSVAIPGTAFFTHTTAAVVHGIPLPARLEEDARLHVTARAPRTVPRESRFIRHSLRMDSLEVVRVGNVRVTSVERTWCDIAAMLTLPELVAAGDYLVHWRGPVTSPELLAEQVGYLRNRRYIRLLRTALLLLQPHSDSPAESQLRVLCAMMGLPVPVVTRVVSDEFEEFLEVTTFSFAAAHLLVRYWGDGPRAPGRTDDAHHEVIDGETWTVLEVVRDDLADPRGFLRRVWRHQHRQVSVS